MCSRPRFPFLLGHWLLSLVLLASCSNQGEGERCDTANGNLDCQAGLLCRRIGAATYDLCCPAADQTPSAPACTNVVVVDTTGDAAPEATVREDGALGDDAVVGDESDGASEASTSEGGAAEASATPRSMAPADLSQRAVEALLLSVVVALPVVAVAAGVGLLVAVLQAATQIQDATISHLPRFLAVAAALAVLGPWMGHQVAVFAARLFAGL